VICTKFRVGVTSTNDEETQSRQPVRAISIYAVTERLQGVTYTFELEEQINMIQKVYWCYRIRRVDGESHVVLRSRIAPVKSSAIG
jgi:hypothetical protein